MQEILINWYNKNKRDLPWRHSKSAYHIWLSEIIMQQTQVIQGLKYYNKFVSTYPTITDLANATEDEIFSMWQGLGYYNRARNLHTTAQFVRDHYKGEFPSAYKDIIKLKGIGIYTAAAISTFAFKKPYPLVDGNVYRLYSRIFNISTEINTTIGQKEFLALAQDLLGELSTPLAVIYNQAIMEYGALVCKPKSPLCSSCDIQAHCISFSKNNHLNLPKKKKNKAKKERILHFFYLYNENGFWAIKRNQKDIWSGLYQFPLLEIQKNQILNLESIPVLNQKIIETNVSVIKHVLTHQNLNIHFHKQYIPINTKVENYEFITKKTSQSIGMPQVIFNFLQQQIN